MGEVGVCRRAGGPQGSGGMVPKGVTPTGSLLWNPVPVAHSASGSEASGRQMERRDSVSERQFPGCGGHCASLPPRILPRAPWWTQPRCGTCSFRILHSSRRPWESRNVSHTVADAASRKASTRMSQAEAIPGDVLPRALPQLFPETSVTASRGGFLVCTQPQTRLSCRRWICVPLSQGAAHGSLEGTSSLVLCLCLQRHKASPHKYPLVPLP